MASLFYYDLRNGQKTGSFLDQRENHAAARQYASGEVLDCFAYQGGFALTVADNCEHVEAVDMAPAALNAARRNQEANAISNVTFREANTFDLLKEYDEVGRRFDMVILDPPAFAKNRASIPAAQRGYKEINLRAMKLLKSGRIPGHLLVLLPHLRASISPNPRGSCHRRAQNDHSRGAPNAGRDHPILLTMPETHYLKCMIIRVL